MRGLKLSACSTSLISTMSHPTWVRGLKLAANDIAGLTQKSHPTWVRGLKLDIGDRVISDRGSHPTWVRGLKRLMNKDIFVEDLVAPYVGAWIETLQSSADKIIAVSRTLRGCVD